MEEICRMMGFSDFKSEQKNRGNNFLHEAIEKTLIQIQDIQQDNSELERLIQQLRQGGHNEAYAGKMVSDADKDRLQQLVRETEQRFRDVEEENRQLRRDLDKKDGFTSTVQSNQRAFSDKLEILEKEAIAKDDLVRKLSFEVKTFDENQLRLREEINLYKGRCSNLMRDLELASSSMNKLNSD